jgi:cytochrome c6
MHRMIAMTLAAMTIGTCTISACMKENTSSRNAPVISTKESDALVAKGAILFKQYCASCHPDGSNVINPQKTLHAAVLADNGITSPERLTRLLRSPGPGMRTFDDMTITDSDAKAIYLYVAKTFR